jgi:hypothetical protein
VSPVKYELGFYIPKDDIHSHRLEEFKSYRVSSYLMGTGGSFHRSEVIGA